MKLGLMFDLRVVGGDREAWSRRYRFILEACEEAERLGADSVWLTEHHGFDDGYLPQPLVYAAAIAARTSRIRIGTAVVVAPFRHPRHLVEEAAVVDLISDGRLDLGLGAGNRVAEYEMFGGDFSRRLRRTIETAANVQSSWSDPSMTPHAVQRTAPLWMGFGGPKGARAAGRLGAGLLSLDRGLLEPYREGLAESEAVARMSGLLSAYPSTDPERDWSRVGSLHAAQWDSYAKHAQTGLAETAHRPVDKERARLAGLSLPGMGLAYGTPFDVARAIRTHVAGLPVDTVMVWGALPGESEADVAEHIRVCAEELRPLLSIDEDSTATQPASP
ncbi:LLM class flavin-dependent oxidoreductase [Microbacterium sp. A84]|uniref:LLM class flavin-dependent oxidoreductase n=1 Tax=Microbacterium sp. A84 TaxID=3450715 RepID=UPI003F42A0BE